MFYAKHALLIACFGVYLVCIHLVLLLLMVQGKGKLNGVATLVYGLGTMNIASFRGMTFDLITKVWVWSLGTL